MKDGLDKGYMQEFIALSPKVYAYEQLKVDKTLSVEKKLEAQVKQLLKRR